MNPHSLVARGHTWSFYVRTLPPAPWLLRPLVLLAPVSEVRGRLSVHGDGLVVLAGLASSGGEVSL